MLSGTLSIRDQDGRAKLLVKIPVDETGVHERAQFFTKRSIKKESKLWALHRIIEMMDLTTLEGADTEGRVRQLCQKARFPVSPLIHERFKDQQYFRRLPSVAAVCVYPNLVAFARNCLKGSAIEIASVATGFPSGQTPLETRLKEVEIAVSDGASEIDMVINRKAFLQGDFQTVFDEIQAVKKACQSAHLKVILETGEIGTFEQVRLASDLAMEAGADFIKTSTGKIPSAASLSVTLVMLNAIKDFHQKTGKTIGMKPAGGIRTAKEAIQYLVMVNETLGPQWLSPKLFRFGASSLLNDVLKQIYRSYSGHYYYDRLFSVD